MKKSFVLLLCLAISLSAGASDKKTSIQKSKAKTPQVTSIEGMRVEYETTPLNVDGQHPRFSWRMTAGKGAQGCYQKAFQIVVRDEEGQLVWDSGKKESSQSLGITYQGDALKPESHYKWTLQVWNQDGLKSTQSSWFETSLLSSSDKDAAWKGARWIGLGDEANVLYSHYLSVFKLSVVVQLDKKDKTQEAAIIYGANDARLMNANKNIYHLHAKRGASYVKVSLCTKELAKKGFAEIKVYRVGYHPSDDAAKPVAIISVPNNVLNKQNQFLPHHVEVKSCLGTTTISLDGKELGTCHLNPVGKGGDYIAFPLLADVGISVEKKGKATFSDFSICAFRQPGNKILTVKDLSQTITGSKTEEKVVLVNPSKHSQPMLRTTFTTRKSIATARLYITARGVYDVFVNGKRVNAEYLNPGLTQYNKTLMYQTYDVTPLLKGGDDNALGVILSEGWWSGAITYVGDNWNYFGDRQSVLARLAIRYTDGTSQDIVTDPATWKGYAEGPMVYGSLFQGEVYDATRETSVMGWATPDFQASSWLTCEEIPLEGHTATDPWSGTESLSDYSHFTLRAQMGNGVQAIDTLTALTVKEVRSGVFVYDMGQNMVGVPLIELNNQQQGDTLTFHYAEVLYPHLSAYPDSGMIMQENIRAALAQDIYIAKGGKEQFSPRFTSHGYRYVEITGIREPLSPGMVKGIVISSIKDLSAHYETDNEKVNRLWKNIEWSTKGNFVSVPTDCPQRNERMGWMGDISVFSRTASYMSDASLFLRRYLQDVRDVQSPDGKFADISPIGGGFGGLLWGSAGITVPWECFLQYGDSLLLREHYDAMKAYVSFVNSKYIDKQSGILTQDKNWGGLGDWLGLEDEKNDKSLLWETYWIYDLQIMRKMATILGKDDDASTFGKMAEQRKTLFNETYIDKSTGKTIASAFKEGKQGQLVDIQTSYVLPLAFDIVRPELREKFIANLKQTIERENVMDNGQKCPSFSLLTGFIGTAWISKVLSDAGLSDYAYRLLRQESYPSWLYPVCQGATTIWERLNSYTHKDGFGQNNSMNSFNHYSFGAVGSWMLNYSLGIQRDETSPGFQHFVLSPEADTKEGLQCAKGYYDSMYGRIESSWQRNGDKVNYHFSIPANTSATVLLDGKKIELQSGEYDY